MAPASSAKAETTSATNYTTTNFLLSKLSKAFPHLNALIDGEVISTNVTVSVSDKNQTTKTAVGINRRQVYVVMLRTGEKCMSYWNFTGRLAVKRNPSHLQ